MRWKAVYFVFISLITLNLTGCITEQGITRYDKPTTSSSKSMDEKSGDDIEILISDLNKISVYLHSYPTGLTTPAPNLDPRLFHSPGILFDNLVGAQPNSKIDIGLPQKEYTVLGEVEIALIGSADPKSSSGNLLTIKDIELTEESLNKKSYHSLDNVNWVAAVKALKQKTLKIGADAVIEVFCGKGISSYWYPPSTGSIPMYGPNGQIVGSYSQTTPGGIGLTGWTLVGMAIKWNI